MNIDKQALRERYSPKPVPECHICGKEMTIQRMSASRITYGCTGATYDAKGCHYAEGRSIADDHYEQSRVTVVDVSDPDVLALLDENIQLQRGKDAIEAVALALRDDMRQAREQLEEAEHRMAEQSAIVAAAEKLVRCKGRYHSELNYRALAKLFGVITPDLPPLEHENVHYADAAEVEITALRQRIAELERSETQLINERDSAESALADMYQAATGERPEWSNMFGFADAVDVVEERLATLESNQSQTTPTGIQFITEAIGVHGYIVGCLLQGRPDLALEESRKWVSAFGQAGEIVSAQDAADIKVKGE
ncbi:ead/Ea22-like family protein [Salmonella enterica subsp. diarizonae]|nr:ead/Ea22-like family protein [Salmonella enterica subsp. diarizonae]